MSDAAHVLLPFYWVVYPMTWCHPCSGHISSSQLNFSGNTSDTPNHRIFVIMPYQGKVTASLTVAATLTKNWCSHLIKAGLFWLMVLKALVHLSIGPKTLGQTLCHDQKIRWDRAANCMAKIQSKGKGSRGFHKPLSGQASHYLKTPYWSQPLKNFAVPNRSTLGFKLLTHGLWEDI